MIPDTAGWRIQDASNICQPTSDWGQILWWLAEEPKVSQSWCWPACGWGPGPGCAGAGRSPLVGGLDPAMAGCGSTIVLGWYPPTGGCGLCLRDPGAAVSSLVCEASPGVSVGPLMGGAEVQGILGLLPAHWWMKLCSRASGCMALIVLDLVYCSSLVSGAGAQGS